MEMFEFRLNFHGSFSQNAFENNFALVNRLVPASNEPSPAPMMTNIHAAIWRHYATIFKSITLPQTGRYTFQCDQYKMYVTWFHNLTLIQRCIIYHTGSNFVSQCIM